MNKRKESVDLRNKQLAESLVCKVRSNQMPEKTALLILKDLWESKSNQTEVQKLSEICRTWASALSVVYGIKSKQRESRVRSTKLLSPILLSEKLETPSVSLCLTGF